MFLPESYKEIPAGPSDYMKFEDGANTFRVLSSAIVGYEYWNTNNKPVRSREKWETIPSDIKVDKDGKIRIRHFWAFVVWNCDKKQIQILEITQKTIMQDMKALVDNPKWGDPKGYDITVTRTGEGYDTEYSTMPNPHSAVEQSVLDEYAKKAIKLEALYEGGNPFEAQTV